MRVIAAPLVSIVLVLTACGTPTVTSTPDSASATPAASAPSAEKAAKVGSTITLQGADEALKVAVKLSKVLTKPAAANEFSTPQDGHRFYAVELVMKNVGTGAYSDSPGNGAYVIDSDDQQYSSTIADVKGGKQFPGTVTISAGDSRRGLVVFEVPKAAKIVKFQFALDSGFADQKGEWTLE
ncbi:DUF4352 domain-containing protein [Nonomuraea africana]|nr:DUF4352 domain-containing protein [Nonomuraea africana]